MEIPRDGIRFTATKSSVKLKLEYNHGKHQVQEAIDLTEGDFGSSIVDAKSPAEHVQNTHQGHYAAQNIRTGNKHKKEWDEEDDHDLIRAIINHAESICLLAIKFQLHSLSQSCTDAVHFRLVSIDPTFNNSPFHSFNVSFRNVVLERNRTGQYFSGATFYSSE